MSARRVFSFTSFATLALSMSLLAYSPIARAQDAEPKADVENSKFQFDGEVNSNGVFVHSGPSETDYPTMKLDHGAKLTVVGIRFVWLKVMPPEGSFCYVAKAYVERHGDGTAGKTTNTVYVRVGSDLNDLKARTALKLDAGKDVTILGEKEEYFKIQPPAGVYLYVNKQYVTPLKQVQVVNDVKVTDPTPINGGGTGGGSGDIIPPPPGPGPLAKGGDTNPTTQQTVENTTTQPAVADAETQFNQLEATFAADAGKPLEDQDPATLSLSYDTLAKSGQLPDSMRRIAEYKAAALKIRAQDRTEYLAVKKQQEETKAKMASLRAEHDELAARVKANEIKSYAAVGTLRVSSLQQGQQTLYRLTDPSTGRTVVYIRSNDSKLGTLMNQFVGVKGDVKTDDQLSLKVIEPTEYETVDQAKLYSSVMAQIVPPSLMPAGSASTGN